MKRKIELKFICLSLLLAGAGMFMTACSNEDEDSVIQATREGGDASRTETIVSAADSVLLDADTLKVFEDYEAKFQLLNADNLPVTTFKEGENFTFQLTFINPDDVDLNLPIGIMDMLVLFDIYNSDGTYLGRPYDSVFVGGSATTVIPPHKSVAFTCKAFGKQEDAKDYCSDNYLPNILLLKTADRDPLPKGEYYTEFTVRFEKGTNIYRNIVRDSVVFKKEFTIE